MGAPKRGGVKTRAKSAPARGSAKRRTEARSAAPAKKAAAPAKKAAAKKAAAPAKKAATKAAAPAKKTPAKKATTGRRALAAPSPKRRAPRASTAPRDALELVPLTVDRFADLEQLFGPNGACGGCWCMYPRTSKVDYEAGKGEPNRAALFTLAANGPAPGLLGYVNGEPVAWVSVAPRASLVRLGSSRILAPVDERPVWSIVCLFVAKTKRRQGLSTAMIEGAAEYAELHGADVVEAYPVEPKGGTVPAAFAWWGLTGAYVAAGFHEVARRSDSRPIMRRVMG